MADRARILFVDDNSETLASWKRALSENGALWSMSFIESASVALDYLKEDAVDVVVAAMGMADMDGATLLRHVRDMWPDAIRIIVSDRDDEDALLRTVGPAHHYLSKPCPADVLSHTIERARALRTFIAKGDLRHSSQGAIAVPAKPSSFARLVRALDGPLLSVEAVARALSEDDAMSDEILNVTNSAYFDIAQAIDNLEDAVALLGVDTVKALVLISSFYKQYADPPNVADQIERMSRRCLGIGIAARSIAQAENANALVMNQACAAGILSHIGTLALIAGQPKQFVQAMMRVEYEQIGIIDAETEAFGAAHPEIGAHILASWGFSDPIVEAVAYHHTPQQVPLAEAAPSRHVPRTVYVSQQLLKTVEADSETGNGDAFGLDMDYLLSIGFADQVDTWVRIVKELKLRACE